MGIFKIDGPFYRFGSMLADIMILSFLWIFFSLPLVTIGASTTALFYVVTKRITNNEGYLFQDFWKSFKENFIISTRVFLIVASVAALLVLNIQNITLMGDMAVYFYPLQLCFLLEIIMLAIYVFPLLSRFDMSCFHLLRTAFFMANRHLLTTIVHIALIVVIFLASAYYPLFILVIAGVYGYASSYFIMKVFKKYRPEVAAGPDEVGLLPLQIGDIYSGNSDDGQEQDNTNISGE